MKISVVIPAYNEEELLGSCLEALNNQTVEPFEIIVVDNNSTDKTAEIAKKYGAKVLFEPKQGAAYARNTGYQVAKGDVLARTDADTIVPKNWIEKLQQAFEKENVAIVCGGVQYHKKNLNFLSHLFTFWVDDIFGYKAVTGPNYGIRKSVWEKIKNKVHNDNDKFHEDLDLAIHAQGEGEYVRLYDLIVRSSTRKFGSFYVFFVKYPLKSIRTLFLKEHRKLSFNPFMKFF